VDAIESGWIPSQDHVGGQAREIASCMSWVGRKNALTLVKHMKDNLDTRINFNSLFDLLKAAHESKV